jgi:hypothetical protein
LFENRVLKKVFLPRRVEVKGGWRELHNKEVHNLCFSQSLIRMIKSKTIMGKEWAGRGTHIGGKARRKDSIRKTKT